MVLNIAQARNSSRSLLPCDFMEKEATRNWPTNSSRRHEALAARRRSTQTLAMTAGDGGMEE
jgi:hypothetical protein